MNVSSKVIVVFIVIISLFSPLYANKLWYETSTGSVYDFDIDIPSSTDNPIVAPGDISNYGGTTEYFSLDGFIGRLLYEGDAGTITVSNVGPIASGTSNPRRFYYTGIESGGPVTKIWREVFFVARVKGRKHNGGTYSGHNGGTNFVIDNNPNSTFTVPGAGSQEASPGDTAYNSNGDSDTYDVSTGYIYKYPYRTVWIDFTVVRTSNDRGYAWWEVLFLGKTDKKYYQSQIRLSGIPGVDQILSLEARYDPGNGDVDPGSYVVSIERLAPDIIPFDQLITKITIGNTYKVGSIRLNTQDASSGSQTQFKVGFYADVAGTSVDFKFSRVGGIGPPIPYNLAFDPIICGNTNTSISRVSSTNNSFKTKVSTVSPIIGGSSYSEHVLLGDLSIYVNSGLTQTDFPVSTYSSTIYAIVTTN